MILVDTSVLIDYFRGSSNKSVDSLNRIVEQNIPFGIAHFIYLEVLQGAKSEEDYNLLKKYLETQIFYELKQGRESYAEAALMYLKLRQLGIKIKSTMDCIIAKVAIENDLLLLHNDQDFNRMSEHFPLKIWDF